MVITLNLKLYDCDGLMFVTSFTEVISKENVMFYDNIEVPACAQSGFQVHMVHTHQKQIAIGASNSGLDIFGIEWESGRADGDELNGSPAGIGFNGSWQTRFDGGRDSRSLHVFVAIYATCTGEEMLDGDEATCYLPKGEKIHALVIDVEYDQYGRIVHRHEHYLEAPNLSMIKATFDGLNFVYEAYQSATAVRYNRVTSDSVGWKMWHARKPKKVPGFARQILQQTVAQLESQFGQGKKFFQPQRG